MLSSCTSPVVRPASRAQSWHCAISLTCATQLRSMTNTELTDPAFLEHTLRSAFAPVLERVTLRTQQWAQPAPALDDGAVMTKAVAAAMAFDPSSVAMRRRGSLGSADEGALHKRARTDADAPAAALVPSAPPAGGPARTWLGSSARRARPRVVASHHSLPHPHPRPRPDLASLFCSVVVCFRGRGSMGQLVSCARRTVRAGVAVARTHGGVRPRR